MKNVVKELQCAISVVKRGIMPGDALPRFRMTIGRTRIKDRSSDPYKLWQKVLMKSRIKRMFCNLMPGSMLTLRVMQRREAPKLLQVSFMSLIR